MGEPVILTISAEGGFVTYELGEVKTQRLPEIKALLSRLAPTAKQTFVKVGGDIPFQEALDVISTCKLCGHSSVAWFPNDNGQ